jgi:thioredoxin reductase (NADPH)
VHLFEEVLTVHKKGSHDFIIHTSKDAYETKNIIVATGFYDVPILMNIPGEELEKVRHYYKDPHFYAYQKVLVVGANNSAVDAALETWRKSAEVTMVIRDNKIGERVKYWVKPDIENRINEGSIKAYFNSCLQSIREHEVDIKTPEGIITVPNDFVLAMTGYKPNFDLLKNIGFDLSPDDACCPVYNEDSMETNQPGIFLAGVVCGGMNTHKWFIENSRIHADKIIDYLKSKQV